MNDPVPYPLRISPGTQVVVRPRGTGVVVEVLDTDPSSYLDRFPAGDDAMVHRNQLAVRKQAQQASLGPPRDTAALMDELLDRWVIYRCVSGSRAYGLDDNDSDVDVRGVFLAHPNCCGPCRAPPTTLNAAP